jgi:hypothetical protein
MFYSDPQPPKGAKTYSLQKIGELKILRLEAPFGGWGSHDKYFKKHINNKFYSHTLNFSMLYQF